MTSTYDNRAGQLRAAVADLPSLSWLHSLRDASQRLAEAITAHLGGSSREEPTRASAQARDISTHLDTASQRIASGIDDINRYLVRHGNPGVNPSTAAWQGAGASQVPTTPDVTLTSLAAFCASAARTIPADPFHRAAEQTARAASRVTGTTTNSELASAVGAFGAARKAFLDAGASAVAAQTALTEYQAAALGT